MLKLYEAENHIDAQLAMDTLLSEDIEVVMKGHFLSGASGELPASGLVTLWLVEPSNEARARVIIDEYEAHKRHVAPPQDCPDCGETVEGNFACCWSCGAQLPEISKSF